MPPVTFVGSLSKIHALLFSKIAHVHDVRTWKFVCFQKIFPFLLHNTRDITRGKGGTIPGRGITAGANKPNNVISTFFQNRTYASKRPQIRTCGRQTCILPQHASSNFVTLSAQCTSRLSSQNGEICLQNTCPSVANYQSQNVLKQNAVDCWSRLNIENILNVEKRCIMSKTSTTLPTPKTAWGTRRDKHTKKLESNNYAGTLSCKVLIASQGYWKWSDNIFPRHSGKREVCSESMTKFSPIQFFYETRLYRGNAISEILCSRLKKIIRDSKLLVVKKHLVSCWAELLSKSRCWQAGMYC